MTKLRRTETLDAVEQLYVYRFGDKRYFAHSTRDGFLNLLSHPKGYYSPWRERYETKKVAVVKKDTHNLDPFNNPWALHEPIGVKDKGYKILATAMYMLKYPNGQTQSLFGYKIKIGEHSPSTTLGLYLTGNTEYGRIGQSVQLYLIESSDEDEANLKLILESNVKQTYLVYVTFPLLKEMWQKYGVESVIPALEKCDSDSRGYFIYEELEYYIKKETETENDNV